MLGLLLRDLTDSHFAFERVMDMNADKDLAFASIYAYHDTSLILTGRQGTLPNLIKEAHQTYYRELRVQSRADWSRLDQSWSSMAILQGDSTITPSNPKSKVYSYVICTERLQAPQQKGADDASEFGSRCCTNFSH